MTNAVLEQKIADLAAPVVQDLGYALVQVNISGVGRATNLQIMAEDPATGKLGIEACSLISRMLSPVLDVADFISDAYRLEVTSPGIDRPLITAQDFDKYKGLDCKIECTEPNEAGQRRFTGVLGGIEADQVMVATEQGPASIPLHNITRAKLAMTDALIAATKNGWPPRDETQDNDQLNDQPHINPLKDEAE
ncbi:MAG: ribosome maturation factor RimP [Pseudomonadota bacterium]